MEKNIHFYYRNIILLLLLFFGINSCKKDYIPNEDIEIISEVPPGIVGWYNQRAVNNGIVINGLHNYNPNESIKNEDKKLTLEPEWAKAVSYKKGDSTIAEVPVNGKGRIAFSTSSRDPNSFDFEKSTSFTQFLFIQTPRKIRGVFMTIVAEDSYLKGNLKKLQNNSFRKKEKDFSGFVLYHSIKGIFLNGFRYKNGNVVGKIYAGSAVDVDRTKTSNEITIKTNITVSCSDIPITIYYQQCTDWFNASSGAFLSTTCKYSSGSGILRECVWATAEGGGGGSGGTPPPTTDPGLELQL